MKSPANRPAARIEPSTQDYVSSFTAKHAAEDNAPRVMFTDPSGGFSGVSPDDRLTIAFSDVMDPTTVTAENIVVTAANGEPVSGAVTYLGYLAFFTPKAPFEPLTRYTARVDSAIKDIEGRSLWGDYSWTFSTTLQG